MFVVNVGSRNPVKIEAVKEAFSEYYFEFKLNPFEVDSGVSKQPTTLEETLKGAEIRADDSFRKSKCNLGVGIEGGLFYLHGIKNLPTFNITACSIYDGKNFSSAFSPAFEIPDQVSRVIYGSDQRQELDGVLCQQDITENPRIGYSDGFISLLSNGVITRKDYIKMGVVMALAKFRNRHMYM